MVKTNAVFPNFIIGGAQKCGTSSLAIWLNEHPELVCSIPKEPDFFSNKDIALSDKDYVEYFSETDRKKTLFEASTGYFTDPKAAQLIHDKFGRDMKFIFILRDPVDRTLSAYYHMLKHGAEKRSIEEVFEDLPDNRDDILDFENDRLARAKQAGFIDNRRQHRYDDHFLQFRYVYNSLYLRHYNVYLELFGADNILLLNLDKFATQSSDIFQSISEFLGVEAFEFLPNIEKAYNKTRVPAYLLSPLIRKNQGLVGGFDLLYRLACKVRAGQFFMAQPPDMPQGIGLKLSALFAPEKEMLSSL